MDTHDFCRLRMPAVHEDALTRHVAERRRPYMRSLICCLLLLPLMLWLGISDIIRLVSGQFTYSETHMEYHAYPDALNSPGYRTEVSPGTSAGIIFLIAFGLIFLILLKYGYGRFYGKGSDHDCLKEQKYAFGTMLLERKAKDMGKHPYCVYDTEGNEYICPTFRDYRTPTHGERMFCAILDNGSRYAIFLEKNEREKSYE